MMKAFLSWIYRLQKRGRARTIKHTFSFATIAVVALMATVLLSQDDTYIRMETPEESVSAGDTFDVAVYVHAKQSVNAVDVAILFPSEKVKVVGIDAGNSVISLWAEDPYVEGDTVILRGGTYRRGFIGEHLLASITFRAVEEGRAELLVTEDTLLAGDGTGNEVDNVQTMPVIVTTVSSDGELSADIELVFTTDIDGNGRVTFGDVEQFLSAWRGKNWVYDFNGDKKMNFTDFAIILADSFFN